MLSLLIFQFQMASPSIYSAQSCRKLPHIQPIILRMQRQIHHFPARARVTDVQQETRASDGTRALKCIHHKITATVTLCLFYGLFKGSFRLLHFRKTHRPYGFQCTSRFPRKHRFHLLKQVNSSTASHVYGHNIKYYSLLAVNSLQDAESSVKQHVFSGYPHTAAQNIRQHSGRK